MALQNLNLALNTLGAANARKPGRDAVAGVLGQRMPAALSQGRPMSPGLEAFQPTRAEPRNVVTTYRLTAKRVGRSAASLPGNPVRPQGSRELPRRATSNRVGSTAGRITVAGRGLSTWCMRHHTPGGHDYPSHDRRDDQHSTRTGHQPAGSAPITNRGK
jgi:hypothetical protein